MKCLLCQNFSAVFVQDVYQCDHCCLVFKDPCNHLGNAEESSRYAHHQNHEDDPGYVAFLNRLLIPLSSFLPDHFSTLDFGCGPGPALSSLMKKKGADVSVYDPLFFPNEEVLKKQYDVVTCTEVVEHFKNPAISWRELISTIKPNGLLAIMTQFISKETNYSNWWYKNDPTHVVFYQEETFVFLASQFKLEMVYNDHHSVIIFKKR